MKIAVVSNPGYITDSYNKNIDNLFRGVGFNTGNLVYMHAVTKHIQDEKQYFGWKVDANLINNEFDVMVFVGANQLHPDKDMTMLAELFESIHIPSFIIGLGAQATNLSQKLTFQKGTLRFIDIIKEKCSHISVRGEYTANVLTDYGVNNIVTTGCPSNFINFDPDLGNKILLKDNNISSLVINNNLRDDMYGFLSGLIANNSFSDIKFIMQEPKLVLDVCRKKINSEYFPQVVEKVHKNIMQKHNIDDVEKFIINNFETFFNVEAWMEYLNRFSFSIGSRMHGNMLALQSGIPTVFLTHDARLQEMVSIMKLPFIEFHKIKNITKIEEAIPLINFNPEEYNKNRKVLAKKFCNIYNHYGIKIHNELKILSSL